MVDKCPWYQDRQKSFLFADHDHNIMFSYVERIQKLMKAYFCCDRYPQEKHEENLCDIILISKTIWYHTFVIFSV